MPTPLRATLPGLGDHLRQIGAARDKEARAAAFEALARHAEEAGAAVPLVLRLISGDTNSIRFALEVAARLTPPLPGELLPPILDLLERPRLPSRLRIAVTAQVIRSIPVGSPVVPRLLDALGRKVSPSRAVNRLRRLAALLPDSVSVARALADLDTGSATPCPRCGARLGPDDFVGHLWERHRLLTENGRVREPWDLIGQWLSAYARTGRPEFLDRSCDLAQALDPAEGLTRAHRLLLKGGSDDEDARALLRAEAAERYATLCPHCFALVPLPSRPPVTTVLVGTGRVDGDGFRVELTDKYLFSHLVVDTPELRVYTGPEPGHALTRRGASLLFLVPLIILAALFAVLPAVLGIAPAVPVGGLLLAAALAYVGVRFTWDETADPVDRAVDHAWTMLVPRMLQYQVRTADAAFLAGLADASRGRGDSELREGPLRGAAATLADDPAGVFYLAPLNALRIDDVARAGGDDLPLVADQVGECFDAKLPLDHGERVVNDLRGDPANRTRRARLRVLILARAFAADLEAEDLRIIGRACPALGAAYASEDRDGLSRLRLLWLYRPRRLWQRVGSATTVFDLARYPTLSENYLKERPDLLLFQPSGGSDEAAPILVCEEGVVYRDTVITDPDTPIRVRARTLVKGGGYELAVGDRIFKFREDPTLLGRRLKGWAVFLFDEFLPRARILTRRRSQHADRLLLQKAATCPDCGQTFLGLAGEIGLAAVPPATEGVG